MRMNGETTLSTIPKPEKALRKERKADGSKVDWETVRRRVLNSSARLAWMDDMPQEDLEKTWAQRASVVAQVIENGETGEQLDIAVVRLGQEVYGLEVDYIFEIRALDNLTRVPRVPEWVAGVVNLRGRIISVLDLPRFLGLPRVAKEDKNEADSHDLVVVETSTMELAIQVDEVLAIEALPVSQIQEATSAVRGIQAEYMRGIVIPTQSGADTIPLLILDLPSLLADKRLIVHEDII